MSSGASAVLDCFHPIIARWFRQSFQAPSYAQTHGWPRIAAGQDTLIAAPTGSGKTLAAFLACIDDLIKRGIRQPIGHATQIVYVSPLKALSNDIFRNLETPLAELRALATQDGIALPPITTAVRTGDTPQSERAKMARKPPHILITTPESLYLLLTSKSGRAGLASVRTVIVDEIHAVAGDKRGAHLTLSLERLDRLVRQQSNTTPTRVGLSATQKPIEVIGRMLCGNRREPPHIVDAGHARALDVAIEITDDEIGAVASHEQMGRVFDRIANLVSTHDTTLVFVNTRRLVERVAHQLEQRLGEEQVVAHHGSMSRTMRFAAEQKLKTGTVKCAVATASLELGIDVGDVDLVVQVGSPRSIATLLQRIGRSGHSLGGTPKGRLFALTRDQLVECAALIRALRSHTLDAILIREAPLDILAQQIVAACACEEFDEDDMFELVHGAFHYATLDRTDFDEVLHILAEGVSDRRGRSTARLHRDRVNRKLRARRGAQLAALTSGGAIPDNANYPVVLYPEETRVGDLDEDFAIESMAGDVFLLGNSSWRIRRVESGRVLVEDAQGASPTVPFWIGEAPARTKELSEEVGALRADIENRLCAGQSLDIIAQWLAPAVSCSRSAADQIIAYLAATRAVLGALPTTKTIVAERFFDDAGGTQLVVHSPFGGRLNRAWGLALRKRFCRSFDFELQAVATDDGILLSLGQPHSFPLDTVFQFLNSKTVRDVLVQALLAAPMFGVRWRWNVTRALAVLRRNGGKKVPPFLVRMRSDDLLGLVFPQQQACLENVVGDIEIPDNPLVRETVRDCLTEAMDIDGLTEVISRIENGNIEVVARDVVEPSPLSHEIVNANPYAFLDDAPLEERRTRAVTLRRGLKRDQLDEFALLDRTAITHVEQQVLPRVDNADELHDALLSMYLIPNDLLVRHGWDIWLEGLIASRRAVRVEHSVGGVVHTAWTASERLAVIKAALPDATVNNIVDLGDKAPEREPALVTIVAAFLDHTGPHTVSRLAQQLGLAADDLQTALYALEADGAVMQGQFTQVGAVEWCNRRVLARIHKRTLTALRKQVEPVTAAAFMRFLFRWQRVQPGSQLLGEDGFLRIIEQLQGFESAAGAWERDILPARLHNYDPKWLDALCLAGQLAWCRLSPRRAPVDADAGSGTSRAAPTRAAPLALMFRDALPWLRAPAADSAWSPDADLDAPTQSVYQHMEKHGACFLSDLVHATDLPASQIEDALWQLVGAGLATADGFAGLRVLIDRYRGSTRSRFDAPRREIAPPKHQRWQKALRRVRSRDWVRPTHALRSLPTASGRWSLLGPPQREATSPEAHAEQLLLRYGVVFRDLVDRESILPPWREIAVVLRRLEARGEIRSGRFVSGFVGQQFALPEAVEVLRSVRREPKMRELVRVSAADPLNLVGITSAGPKVHAVIGNTILYCNGVPIASLEAGELNIRGELEAGATVDEHLVYHSPQPQLTTTLPLWG